MLQLKDEVARADLSALRSEVEQIAQVLSNLGERIAAQDEVLRDLAARQQRAEQAQVERLDRADERHGEASERIAALEEHAAGLRHDHDALVGLTHGLDHRLNESQHERMQLRADVVRIERQAEADLRETRSNDHAFGQLLVELRRKLAEVSRSVTSEYQADPGTGE